MDIEAHLAMSEISLAQHTNRRHVELGVSLDDRFALYLDQNFWITLRKAEAGLAGEAELELLRLVRQATQSGLAFCPISESVFLELLKQDDVQSRLRTARLVDELSLGVSLASVDNRIAAELKHFIYSSSKEPPLLHPLRHLVWTKMMYVLGLAHPLPTSFDAKTTLAVQKAFFDKAWSISLVEVVNKIESNFPQSNEMFFRLATSLNGGSLQNSAGIRNFKQAYHAESQGVVDAMDDILMEVLGDIAAKHKEPLPARESEAWQKLRNGWRGQIFIALQEDVGRNRLPTAHVLAALHAAFRWDKGREFEANDFYDFHHAAAALGYCQAFFTEGSLRAVATANNVRLDKLHGCRVESTVSGAIDCLRALLPATQLI